MDASKIRLDEPLITVKKNPKKNKHTKSKNRDKYQVLKQKGLLDTKKQPYDTLSEERLKSFKKSVIKAMAKRVEKSPRFANERKRIVLAGSYKQSNITKLCTICNIRRGLTDFDKHNAPDKSDKIRRSYCRQCRKKMNKEAYLRNKK